jgi:hypothetical protein
MKKSKWKYVWALNEPYVVKGGIGNVPAKKLHKTLKKRKIEHKFKIASSDFVNYSLILFFVKSKKIKNKIQKYLFKKGYVIDIDDTSDWTSNEDIIYKYLKK